MGVYITIYKHKHGEIYVQLNKTAQGQNEFIKNLSKTLFEVVAVGYQTEKEIGD